MKKQTKKQQNIKSVAKLLGKVLPQVRFTDEEIQNISNEIMSIEDLKLDHIKCSDGETFEEWFFEEIKNLDIVKNKM